MVYEKNPNPKPLTLTPPPLRVGLRSYLVLVEVDEPVEAATQVAREHPVWGRGGLGCG